MTPEQYVQDKAAQSGSSFYYAFRFLPPPQRAAITAFYAFCREVDDVVDEVVDPSVAAIKLAWWRKEVANAYVGRPSHPAMQALMPHTPPTASKRRTCWLSSKVARWTCSRTVTSTSPASRDTAIWSPAWSAKWRPTSSGVADAATIDYAHRLGLAMQLTNIIRDVGDDARRGRIYLPKNELKQFDVKANELLERKAPWGYSDRFTQLMRFQVERAHRCYDEAFALLPAADRRAQRPAWPWLRSTARCCARSRPTTSRSCTSAWR